MRCDVGGGGQSQPVLGHIEMNDVPWETLRDEDLTGAVLGCVGVLKEGLTAKHAADAFEHSALKPALHIDVGRHADHRTGLNFHTLAVRELECSHGPKGPVFYFDLHGVPRGAGGSELRELLNQRADVSCLEENAAFACELANEAFTGEKEAFDATVRTANIEVQVSFETDDMPVIDDIGTVDVDHFDAPVGVKPDGSLPMHLKEEESFFGEEPAQATKAHLHIDIPRGCDIGARAQHERGRRAHVIHLHGARHRRRQPDTRGCRGAKRVHEEGLSSDQLANDSDKKATDLLKESRVFPCIHGDAHRHLRRPSDHRSSLCDQLFTRLKVYLKQGKGRRVRNLMTHDGIPFRVMEKKGTEPSGKIYTRHRHSDTSPRRMLASYPRHEKLVAPTIYSRTPQFNRSNS